MNVILLHNAKAGQGESPEADQLLGAIREAGHTATYQATVEKGAKWTMLDPTDLVIVAGGDGTVRKAALAVAGRKIPLAILPLGTANNLANTLGITASVYEIIHNLDTARRVRLDVGLASGPWGKTTFIESAGAGLLARVISYLSENPAGASAPSVQHAHRHLRSLLETYPARSWSVAVDDRKFTERLILVEAMNTLSVGPNLHLAPESDPGDGMLDFVFLKEENRGKFATFLQSLDGAAAVRPPVEILRGRSLQLGLPRSEPVHVDDHTWPPEKLQVGAEDIPEEHHFPVSLEIHVTSEPIEVLVPR